MKAILESGIPGVFFWLYDDDDGYDIFFLFLRFSFVILGDVSLLSGKGPLTLIHM